MISIATPSSNGHSSRLWPAQVPTMMSQWVLCNIPGAERDTFIGLSKESSEIGRKMGITYAEDPIEYNLKVIDKLDPDSTASMQKDIAKGHESEIQGLLFDMIALGEKMDVDMPTYRKVAQKFKI